MLKKIKDIKILDEQHEESRKNIKKLEETPFVFTDEEKEELLKESYLSEVGVQKNPDTKHDLFRYCVGKLYTDSYTKGRKKYGETELTKGKGGPAIGTKERKMSEVRDRLDVSFRICTTSLQKAGYMEPGKHKITSEGEEKYKKMLESKRGTWIKKDMKFYEQALGGQIAETAQNRKKSEKGKKKK